MNLNGKPMLERIVNRIQRARLIDEVVIATTSSLADEDIVELCASIGVPCVTGSEFDVLGRFVYATRDLDDTDVLVRVTGDCPFVDPALIDECVDQLVLGGFDFVANRLPPPFDRKLPLGLDVEVSTVKALRTAGEMATNLSDREHVMPYLYRTDNAFNVKVIDYPEDLSSFRWTVDTPEDFHVVAELDRLVGKEPFGWRDVLDIARENPELSNFNDHVGQKSLDDTDARNIVD